jgi:peptidoglycan/LPS O-acetylase OafA/YrhL
LILVTFLITTGLTDPANGTNFGLRDFLVYFFLVQDAVGNVSPNGAFWSIAVEWHIYFLYPIILLLFRRWGLQVVVFAILGLVVIQHLVGVWVPAVAMLNRFTPVYLFLFAGGVGAAWLVRRKQVAKTSIGIALGLLSGFLAYAIIAGTEATIASYFWVDLIIGCATAALFVAIDQGRLNWASSALSWRPLVTIGSFAFSLYLIHAPILAMITTYIVKPLHADDMISLAVLIVLGLPASILIAYTFFLYFERPFLTIRSFGQLLTSIRSSLSLRKMPSRQLLPVAPIAPSNIPNSDWKTKS